METSDSSFFGLIDVWLKKIPRFVEAEKDDIKIHHDPGSFAMNAFTMDQLPTIRRRTHGNLPA